MKKLEKKLSYLTKIVLVIGLIISNLSPLSIVFAYKAESLLQLTLNNDKLNITYLDNLDEYEKVDIKVYENYTYLDNTSYYIDDIAMEEGITGKETLKKDLPTLEFLQNGYELETILKNIVFDGFYEVKVELLDETNEIIDTATYSNDIKHQSGLSIKVYDELNNEIELTNEAYTILKDNPKAKIVAKKLPGGLSPMEKFQTEDTSEFTAKELIEYEFTNQVDFSNLLFGEYTLPVAIKLYDKDNNLLDLTENIKFNYESKSMNDQLLNQKTTELTKDYKYEFNDGKLYTLIQNDEENTVLEIYQIISSLYETNEKITYTIGNDNNENIIESFDSEQTDLSLDDYLQSILLDNTTYITLSCEGLTIRYEIQVVGDYNNDNTLDTNDILDLINYIVNNNEPELDDKYDLNKDENVDLLDLMYLDQIIKNETYEVELETKEDTTINANLLLNNNDIVSGDEFTVSYIVSIDEYEINGFAGNLKYDKDMFELISISSPLEWLGVSNEGKFVYLGTDSLTADKILNDENNEEIFPHEYNIINVTFKALKSGTSEVSIEDLEYFNQEQYLDGKHTVEPLLIEVNASDDNSLSSLTVAGQSVSLEEDVFDYTITVKNDVTAPSVAALTSSITANITSIIAPEELIEGENIVEITVTSESGNEKIYTVKVIREAAPQENNTTQINYTTDNNNNHQEEDNKENLIITEPSTEDKEKDTNDTLEEDNLSRIIIIILILLVIAGLIYLIFKDDEDEDTKKVNKEVNKLKKETVDITEIKVENKTKTTNKNSTNKNNTNKNSTNKNKKTTNKRNER